MLFPPRKSHRRRGGALVEFALVALQVCILLFAGFEFGRILLAYTSLANAARVGTRYAATHGSNRSGGGPDGDSGPGDTTEVVNVVKEFGQLGLLDPDNVAAGTTVTYAAPPGVVGPACNAPGCIVTVTIKYPYDPFTLLPFNVTFTTVSAGAIIY